jgi:hypothetical protein
MEGQKGRKERREQGNDAWVCVSNGCYTAGREHTRFGCKVNWTADCGVVLYYIYSVVGRRRQTADDPLGSPALLVSEPEGLVEDCSD